MSLALCVHEFCSCRFNQLNPELTTKTWVLTMYGLSSLSLFPKQYNLTTIYLALGVCRLHANTKPLWIRDLSILVLEAVPHGCQGTSVFPI